MKRRVVEVNNPIHLRIRIKHKEKMCGVAIIREHREERKVSIIESKILPEW